jgi:DNA invertase Pin-like site-specific DNA recombinase
MTVALYARVSSQRQTTTQTIDQQLDRLRARAEEYGVPATACLVFRDDGYSGASLRRPGLDALRDAVASAEVERILITAPDRLARKYVHQVLVLEELERFGCMVEFLDRPMSHDPHDQLLLQIRGAVAEYERTLIAERMRRGRLAKLRTGTLLPWTCVPYGYHVDPDRPRDPTGVQMDPAEGAVVQEIFARYLEDGATLGTVAAALERHGILTSHGRRHWSRSTLRWMLHNRGLSGTGLCLPDLFPPSPKAPVPASAGRAPGNDVRTGCPRDLGAGGHHSADYFPGALRPGSSQTGGESAAGPTSSHQGGVPLAGLSQLRSLRLHLQGAARVVALCVLYLCWKSARPPGASRRSVSCPLHPGPPAG